MRRADGWEYDTPALVSESVEAVVPRGHYALAAIFLTKPASISDKPMMVATGVVHEVLASNHPQKITIVGSAPTDEELGRLRSEISDDQRVFRLPRYGIDHRSKFSRDLTARLRRLKATKSQAPAHARLSREATAARFRRRLEATTSQALESQESLPSPRTPPVPTAPPAHAREETDDRCVAGTSSGGRCQKRPVRDALCQMHYEMASRGRTVTWYDSGTPVRPRCQARGDSGGRCDEIAVREFLCTRHLSIAMASQPVFWSDSNLKVVLDCGARTKAGTHCQNVAIQQGLCGAHLEMLRSGKALHWFGTGQRIQARRR